MDANDYDAARKRVAVWPVGRPPERQDRGAGTMLDRNAFIELLDRLGADDDETVLAAARTLHRSVREAGVTWDDLLCPEEPPEQAVAVEDEPVADAPADGAVLDDAPEEVASDMAEPAEAEVAVEAATDIGEDAKLVDRLLARKGLSAATREDLADFKRDIAKGRLSAADRRYIRALAKRLGV